MNPNSPQHLLVHLQPTGVTEHNNILSQTVLGLTSTELLAGLGIPAGDLLLPAGCRRPFRAFGTTHETIQLLLSLPGTSTRAQLSRMAGEKQGATNSSGGSGACVKGGGGEDILRQGSLPPSTTGSGSAIPLAGVRGCPRTGTGPPVTVVRCSGAGSNPGTGAECQQGKLGAGFILQGCTWGSQGQAGFSVSFRRDA